MGAKTINIDDLGPVLLEKSSRAKHINISVKQQVGYEIMREII